MNTKSLSFLTFLIVSQAAHAGLLGSTVTVGYAYPNPTTYFAAPMNVQVGNGIEINCPAGSTGFCAQTQISQPFTLDIGDNTISFTQGLLGGPTSYLFGPFNGWVFTNLNLGAPITGFTLTSNGIANLTNASVQFTANSLTFNSYGDAVQASNSWSITLQTGAAATPEPSSVLLVAIGAVGALVAGRRRRLSSR